MSELGIQKLMDPKILSAILDASSDGFTYTDETGHIVYSNDAYNRLTGISDEVIQGSSVYELVKEGYPISRMVLEVFECRKSQSELIKYHADSDQVLMVTASPVYDQAGIFRGVVGNVRDMSELMQLQQKLEVTSLNLKQEILAKEEANRALTKQINELLNLMKDFDIIGKSKAMQEIADLAKRISHVNSTVLITGESGVGKDVFCRMVCRFSGLPDYIKVSCSNIPEHLLESELFGYEPGAFTGASRNGKPGILEVAGDGVIFLDEIGEMPLAFQAKLLTVLQDRQFYRVGGTKVLPMNARIVAATNRDLKAEVERGNFRQDLYYRLNVIPIHIPPLRERVEDILPLAEHILSRLNRENDTQKVFGIELQKRLLSYNWPGNVRELNNVVERLYVLSADNTIGTDCLPNEILNSALVDSTAQFHSGKSLRAMLESFEASVLAKYLEDDRPLRSIADDLGIDLSTLVRKIKRYDLPKRYHRK